jgi:hypothetical protein
VGFTKVPRHALLPLAGQGLHTFAIHTKHGLHHLSLLGLCLSSRETLRNGLRRVSSLRHILLLNRRYEALTGLMSQVFPGKPRSKRESGRLRIVALLTKSILNGRNKPFQRHLSAAGGESGIHWERDNIDST